MITYQVSRHVLQSEDCSKPTVGESSPTLLRRILSWSQPESGARSVVKFQVIKIRRHMPYLLKREKKRGKLSWMISQNVRIGLLGWKGSKNAVNILDLWFFIGMCIMMDGWSWCIFMEGREGSCNCMLRNVDNVGADRWIGRIFVVR